MYKEFYHKSTYECSDFKVSKCLSLLIHSLAEIQRSIRLSSGTKHDVHNSAVLYTWKFSPVQNFAECCFNRINFLRYLLSSSLLLIDNSRQARHWQACRLETGSQLMAIDFTQQFQQFMAILRNNNLCSGEVLVK